MDSLMSPLLWELLLISITFSIFLMALVQKMKKSKLFHTKWQIWFMNLVLSFVVGIPFTKMFYGKSLNESLWVSLFGFIGAPSLYEALKKQNLIAYKPNSSGIEELPKDTITLPLENEIPRKKGEEKNDTGV